MPWGPAQFAKHNKKLKGRALRGAAAAATRVLEQTGDEGRAVRTGNAVGDKLARKKKGAKRG